MATTSMEYSDHKYQFEPLPGLDEDIKYEVPPLDIDPNNRGDENRKRRFSVSAEASDDKKVSEKFVKKVYPKSAEAMNRIKQSVNGVFLFNGLDAEQRALLIDAMFEKKVKKGDEVISQGDRGDYFYIIESGIYEVWKSSSSVVFESKKVFEYVDRGSFGELALMYNAPRAATVKSITFGVLWAVDRSTFRHIIVGSTARKRKKYDNLLKDIKLLYNTSDDIRVSIADILETQIFNKNDYILRKGQSGQHFFFISKGEAKVTLNKKENGVIRRLYKGDYFGERALLLNEVRSANVIVVSDKIEVVGMDKASFIRLLAPLYHKFRANAKHYIFSNNDNDDDEDALSDIE